MKKNPISVHDEDLLRLSSCLNNFDLFIKENKRINCINFDYATIHDINLFSTTNEINFETVDIISNYILKMEGSLKRIFSKPIIFLKDRDEVLPVEEVHYINHSSIEYLINHSQDVVSVKKRKVKPRRLLTRISEDDYGLYENRIFVEFVNAALGFIKDSLYRIKNYLAMSESLYFNLLERNNHHNYFLSLGMLETGYIREFGKYEELAKKLYARLKGLNNFFTTRLKKPVYAKNKNHQEGLKLKKTNIFLMQKDYHKVYLGYKYLLNNNVINIDNSALQLDKGKMQNNYFEYVTMLSIFSILRFNFELPRRETMNIKKIDTTFTFKKWSLRLKNLSNNALLIKIKKDLTFNIVLTPFIFDKDEKTKPFVKSYCHKHEVYYTTPFDDIDEVGSVRIASDDINSFRKIQQIILKGMIYSDTKHETCPFCGEDLHYDKVSKAFVCSSCGTMVAHRICPETQEVYYYTDISFYEAMKREEKLHPLQYQFNKKEFEMYYRNITGFDSEHRHICPKCGKIHNIDENN